MRALTRAGAAIAAVTAAATAVAGLAPATAAPSAPKPSKQKVLVKDLKSPKAMTIDARGHVVIGQGGLDPALAGMLVRYNPDKDKTKHYGKKIPVTAIAYTDAGKGGYWTLRPAKDGKVWLRFQKTLKSKAKKVKNITAFTAKNPDPYDTEGSPKESNPFGLAVNAKGDALVTDAAANAVYQVKRKGKARVIARFQTELISTDHIPADEVPPGEELPPQLPAESVPTDIAVGDDGTIYVSELKGFPFRPGSSRIYAVKAKAKGKPAVCAPTKKDSKRCKTFADGLTGIATIAVNPAGGLVAVGYAEAGVLAFEGGCFGPDGCPPAALWTVSKKGKVRKVENPKLSAPGTVRAFGKNKFYVTDNLAGAEGRLLRLKVGKKK